MYARTNRCYNERESRTNYVRSSIPHCIMSLFSIKICPCMMSTSIRPSPVPQIPNNLTSTVFTLSFPPSFKMSDNSIAIQEGSRCKPGIGLSIALSVVWDPFKTDFNRATRSRFSYPARKIKTSNKHPLLPLKKIQDFFLSVSYIYCYYGS